jgi:opacity protein-like surface antigen
MGRSVKVLILGVAMVAMAVGSASALGYGHIRDGWSYGFGLGVGWTRLTATDVSLTPSEDLKSSWEADFSGDLKVAFSPNDQFSYGLGFSGWSDYSYWGDNYDQLKTWTLWILVQGHWYPAGKGLYLRGGAGLGTLGLELNHPVARISQSSSGLGWELGAGYEVRVAPSFAIGLGYDLRGVNVGSVSTVIDDTDVLDDLQAITQTATLTFTWYPD